MLLHPGYWQCEGYARLTLQGVHLPLLTSAPGMNFLFYRISTVQRQGEAKFVIHRMSRHPPNLDGNRFTLHLLTVENQTYLLISDYTNRLTFITQSLPQGKRTGRNAILGAQTCNIFRVLCQWLGCHGMRHTVEYRLPAWLEIHHAVPLALIIITLIVDLGEADDAVVCHIALLPIFGCNVMGRTTGRAAEFS